MPFCAELKEKKMAKIKKPLTKVQDSYALKTKKTLNLCSTSQGKLKKKWMRITKSKPSRARSKRTTSQSKLWVQAV